MTNLQQLESFLYNPDWKPLERAVQLAGLPLQTCGDFMFMHQDSAGVCHYKHIDTRNYASVRIDSTPEVCIAQLANAQSLERTWGKALDAERNLRDLRARNQHAAFLAAKGGRR